MARSSAELAPPHIFPIWPMDCLAFYSHAMRDFSRYAQAMTTCTDPMQAARAEGDFGVSLWRDAMQAYYDLAVLPMKLAIQAAAQHPAAQPNEEPSRAVAAE